ncbi:MarR family winged helix-turn-helix transcriptional regulator [Altererythrobacter sp. GH1-8]|uniref:MarR family winged helix-turn-helix transcriptional regulator n=1 Tax=Altererythrobacter sp. GH1-8 TaxID=3349333 RepID=UPI00374DBB17
MSETGGTQKKLADFLPYQLSITSNAVSSVIASRYRARFGLKVPEWRVMAVLGDAGAATQRHLTEATLMDKVAVNRACKVLEDRGLITREPNSRDGRSHLLNLTDEGRAVYAEVMPLAQESEREIFAGLDPEQQVHLRKLLAQVFDHAKRIRPATS